MNKFALDPEMSVEVLIRFIAKGSDEPLYGPGYRVKLFDKDIIGADHLGESGLDQHGVARIRFSHSAFGEWNTLEKYPDFYFVLEKNGKEVYKSGLMENFDMKDIERFRMGEGEVVELGTYLVEA